MHKHRLDKLAKLTKGAALVGIGALVACRSESHTVNGPDPNPIHTNAPPEPEPSTSASAVQSPPRPTNMPHINAPPRRPDAQ